jgi:YesN/AraC family two-component response regulator
MVFVDGGHAALAELASEPFDVVVSDMRMPVMTGAELLQLIRQRHPETVRLVLSGHSEFERTLAAAPFAHQFLAKPCPPNELQSHDRERTRPGHDHQDPAALSAARA